MDNIKIVRLQNGEDIIGSITSNNSGIYDISEPMSVEVTSRNGVPMLGMAHWLPIQLVKTNEVTLTDKDILCMVDPSDDFIEYYTNTVEKLRDLIKAKNLLKKEMETSSDTFEEDIEEIMNHLKAMPGDKDIIH
jgi:hypothetical protein